MKTDRHIDFSQIDFSPIADIGDLQAELSDKIALCIWIAEAESLVERHCHDHELEQAAWRGLEGFWTEIRQDLARMETLTEQLGAAIRGEKGGAEK